MFNERMSLCSDIPLSKFGWVWDACGDSLLAVRVSNFTIRIIFSRAMINWREYHYRNMITDDPYVEERTVWMEYRRTDRILPTNNRAIVFQIRRTKAMQGKTLDRNCSLQPYTAPRTTWAEHSVSKVQQCSSPVTRKFSIPPSGLLSLQLGSAECWNSIKGGQHHP